MTEVLKDYYNHPANYRDYFCSSLQTKSIKLWYFSCWKAKVINSAGGLQVIFGQATA